MLKEQVLYHLERSRGKLVTGGELASRLGVSRTAVWKAISRLREEGNIIESVAKRGYALAGESDGISKEIIREGLATAALGQSMELLRTVSSTNRYLKSLDAAGLPHGHTVISDEQTAGRGRLGRTFESPAGQGLYMSVLLKPDIPLEDTPFLTICAAVAASKAVDEVFGLNTGLKWVNDVYAGGKKLCGILTEASVSAEIKTFDSVVLGIGTNTGDVPQALRGIATSTLAESGLAGRRNSLAACLLNNLERVFVDFTQNGARADILAEYKSRMLWLGETVEVRDGSEKYRAVALDIDGGGGLVVRRDGGEITRLAAGEVSLLKSV